MNTITPFVLISSNALPVLFDTITALGLSPTEVNGKYQGINEKSLLVPLRSFNDDSRLLLELAHVHNQESILLVDANGLASLEYPKDHSSRFIGRIFQVPKEHAERMAAYTEINGEYFIVT